LERIQKWRKESVVVFSSIVLDFWVEGGGARDQARLPHGSYPLFQAKTPPSPQRKDRFKSDISRKGSTVVIWL
jgi:hypothetical protein